MTIPAGGYLLVQQAQGAGGTTPLPTPDATGTSPMSATNGKVALASTTTPLAGTGCPIADTTIDLVGFGSANCFEGAGAAPTLSNTTAAFRADAGCTDTDDNAADFTADAPAPRNSSTTPAPCGGSGEPVNQPVVATCDDLTVIEGESGAVALTASDADGTVTGATITSTSVDGITLEDVTPATTEGGELTADLTAADDARRAAPTRSP